MRTRISIKGSKRSKKDIRPKDILKLAERTGAKGNFDKALELFESSVQAYLKMGSTLKALAAAKSAKTVLGPKPKVEALLIRLYESMGLTGDAQKEFYESASLINKEKILLFKGLEQDEFVDFLEIMDILNTSKGQVILKQEDTGEEIYIIVDGKFEVVRDGNKVAIMNEGDIFGEIGFFHHAKRSASVRSKGKGILLKIPGMPLRDLCIRYPNVHHALESVYIERILKKAKEDLRVDPGLDLIKDDLSYMHFAKGQEINLAHTADITIVRHGVVEINYNEKGLNKKIFIGPGSVFKKATGKAKANTDVDIIQAKVDITAKGPGLQT